MSRSPRPASTVITVAVAATAALLLSGCGGSDGSDGAAASSASGEGAVKVGLITKTETNPFFVKMKEGAQKEATAKGVTLLTAAGKFDGDNASQVTAVENDDSVRIAVRDTGGRPAGSPPGSRAS